MSMHKIPLTDIEREGLKAYGLDIGTPSQLSDCFRHGVKWAQEQSKLLEPDMFWNHDDAEKLYSSIDEFLNDEICNGFIEVGDIRIVQQAFHLPNVTIRIKSIDENECEAEWEAVSEATHGIGEQS